MSMAQIKAAFDIFDKDKSGLLSAEELRAILSRGPNPMLSEAEIDEVIREFDANGDGELSIDEFARATASMSDEEGEALQDRLDEYVVNEAFGIFDLDDDGVLNKKDLSSILTRQEWDKPTAEPMLSPGEVDMVLSEYGDGNALNLAQFTNACHELTDAEAEALKKRMAEVVRRRNKLREMNANQPAEFPSSVDESESASSASKLHMMLVTLDYNKDTGPSGYSCTSGSLTCSIDAIRVGHLASICGCTDVVALVDVRQDELDASAAKLNRPSVPIHSHPSVANVKSAWKAMASRCSPGDTVFFFYSGHGSYYTNDLSGDEADGKDEILCCTKEDGKGDYLKDDTLSALITELPDGVRVLTVVDACHSGTPTDLDTHDYGSRQVMHIGAVSDTQVASDVRSGGALTGAILESLGVAVSVMNAGAPLAPPSVADVYDWCVKRYGPSMEKNKQSMVLGKTKTTNVEIFPWPLFPRTGEAYEPETPMANRGNRGFSP